MTVQWPNLKNLSGGLNLSRGWLVPLQIVSNVKRFKPALNLNRVLADLNRGLNSLNSISGPLNMYVYLVNLVHLDPISIKEAKSW